MSTISVTPVQQNNHIIYIDNATNAPYFNLAQAEIIFPNVSLRQIRKRLKEVSLLDVKKAKVVTAGGLQGVTLYPANVLVSLAFEFDLDLAKNLSLAGATVFLYGLAGYEVKPQPKPSIDAIEWIDTRINGKHVQKSRVKLPRLFHVNINVHLHSFYNETSNLDTPNYRNFSLH